MDSDVEYCRDLLARRDYGFYVLTLMLPRENRPYLWALGVVRLKLRDIPMTVSEPTLGYIRLQWWREQFEAQAAGKSFAAEPALRVLSSCNIPSVLWHDFLEGYEQVISGDLEDDEAFKSLLTMQLSKKSLRRFETLERTHARLLEKYRNSRWHSAPPFLALRLWLSATF